MRVELVTDAGAATPPIVTVAPARNWLPTTDTAEPPAAGPEAGVRYAAWKVVAASSRPQTGSKASASAAAFRVGMDNLGCQSADSLGRPPEVGDWPNGPKKGQVQLGSA